MRKKNIKKRKKQKRILGEEDEGGTGDIYRNTHTESNILRGSNTVKGRERRPRSKTILSGLLFRSCY